MKNFLLFYIFLFSTSYQVILAQVPNGDFEQWNNGEPVGWHNGQPFNMDSIVYFGTLTQTSDAHGGLSALKVEGNINNSGLFVIVQEIFPVFKRYANETGFYKLNLVGRDYLLLFAQMFKNGQDLGFGSEVVWFSAAANYTNFIAPINYYNPDTTEIPDTCVISFRLGSEGARVQPGTVLYIDDITLQEIATSVEDVSNITTFELYQNYPNPFNPATKIKYSIPAVGNAYMRSVQLKVYDVLGKEITTLLNKEQRPGNYEVEFDGSKLPSGVYLYRLIVGDPESSSGQGFVSTKKLILLK